MTRQPKADTLDELAHQEAMVVALRKRLRVLELQMAQQGIATPPHILTEVASLTEQVQRHKTLVNQLEMLAAEGDVPIAEVEYRMLLAENWSTSQGYPSVVGATRLEFARLRLGILPERAIELEYDIRGEIAREVIKSIHDSFYTDYLQGFAHALEDELWTIGRAIRLNARTATDQFIQLLPPEVQATDPPFAPRLLLVNQFWLYQDRYKADFEYFISSLPEALQK